MQGKKRNYKVAGFEFLKYALMTWHDMRDESVLSESWQVVSSNTMKEENLKTFVFIEEKN